MVVMLVAGAVLFSAVSVLEFRRLDDRLTRSAPMADISALLAPSSDGSDRSTVSPEFAVRVSLETYVTAQRYELARTMLRARLWTRFMGFLTGMIMAMVGAAFVLGRLREEGSSFQSSGAGLSLAMTSASPGLILAGLGTVLMSLCLVVAPSVQTSDGSVYLRDLIPSKAPAGAPTDAAPPPPLDNMSADDIINSLRESPPPVGRR